jgi:uncharacterized cupin superfamily protein
MKIIVQRLSDTEIASKGINNWPIWEKEASKFDWYYDDTEYCLILEGKIIVTSDHEEIEINEGDFVMFPKGLSCVWDIKKDIRKHYKFQ